MSFDSSLQRAAVLVKSLPQQQATKLLAKLEPNELKKIVEQIRELVDLSESSIRLARHKFLEKLSADSASPATRANDSKDHPFGFLECVSENLLLELLSAEHPSIIATVLAYLSTDVASNLLVKFEPALRVSILRRLCNIAGFEKSKIKALAHQLEQRLRELVNIENLDSTGVEIASRLLSCADDVTRDSLIDVIDHDNQELATQIRERVFRFQEIERLCDRDIKTILQWTDTALWAPALKNASKKLSRKILNNMAERPRIILKGEIASLPTIDSLATNQARSSVVKTIILLADKKLIVIDRKPSENNGARAA